jgi:hypothetical protein
MSPSFRTYPKKPIVFLLAVNILIGLFVFRDYGLSWDEPLFYDYGEALGYAYSPREWLSGDFDLSQSFGASGDDHKTRGPAYLVLGRGPVYLLELVGLDQASSWHLVNFLFFQLGVYFLYRLAARWINPPAALGVAALFAWQPLLWGHAFINPKDPPFLTFFLASVCLGFEMVDRLSDEAATTRQRFRSTWIPAIFLGITTSIRVLGPLAGLLVFLYGIWKFRTKLSTFIGPFLSYALITILVMLITWPYLWEDPAARFSEVFTLMSDNPTQLSVLFGGEVYRAGELPRRYLPFMLGTTLTEPVWPLFFLGVIVAYWRLFTQSRSVHTNTADTAADAWRELRSSLDLETIRNNFISVTLVLLWFAILVAYVLIRRPAMYDGLRHFLFILPPIFIFTGFTFEFLYEQFQRTRLLSPNWLYAGLVLVLLLPGVFGFVRLHPYEYTYYNSFIGGTDGASRQYETDYWLTCYKDAVQQLNETTEEPINLYVHREGYIAAYYASEDMNVYELRGALAEVQSGDFILVNTRTNEDRRVFQDAPVLLQVGRGDAVFCVIKRNP